MQTAEHITQTQLSAAKQALLEKRLKQVTTVATTSAALMIGRRPQAETIPLSFAQQRLWFLQQVEPESAAYNEALAARLHGPFNSQAFGQAFCEIVRRHHVLRCRFPLQDGQVVQILDEQIVQNFEFFTYDLRHLPPEQRNPEMLRWTQQQMRRPFDLKTELPWRLYVVRLDEQEHISLTIMHHIVTDGWSWSIFHREFSALYAAFSQGTVLSWPELTVQYGDYAHWQREWVESEAAKKQQHYWQRQLQGPLPLLDLPTTRRSLTPSYRGRQVAVELPPRLAQQVQALGRQEGTTPFMTLLSAFLILLYRYTQQGDLLVGTPIAGRTRPEVENLFGCFLNTLVLRTQLTGDLTVQQVLKRVREVTLSAYDHQEYPFEKLVEVLQPERDLGRNPFFQVMFSLQNAPLEPFAMHGLRWTPFKMETETAKFDLELALQESAQGITGHFEYNADLFDPGTIERLQQHFEQIVRAMVAQPQQNINDLPLLTEQEEALLLHGWDMTQSDYPDDLLYLAYVQAQVQAQPEEVAVGDGQEQISYQELWQRATHLAAHLQTLGVLPEREELLGLYMERSVAWAVAVLATQLAGGVYLPLDPHYPAGRLRYILQHAKAHRVLTTRASAGRLAELLGETTLQVLCVEDLLEQAPRAAYQPVTHKGNQLAYVIYTSGSTGQPKGVMIEQRGMLNHLLAKIETLEMEAQDLVAQTASACFDISIWQLLSAWLVGGQVRIYPDQVMLDPQALLQQVEADGISFLEVVPSLLRAMLETLDSLAAEQRPKLARLRWMTSTGEALPVELVQRWLEHYPQIPVVNAYGPTECSDNVTQHVLYKPPRAGETRVPIGRSLPNLHLYVLDAGLRVQPVGVWGEIYIGGIGVGRGYLDDPERTAQAFVPDQWSPQPGGRLYRTGDVGRYRANGVLDYLGRRDQQVKVRGYRIELGEIEQAIRQHSRVTACVVSVYEEAPGMSQLVAYVVPEAGEQGLEQVLDSVRQVLPEYMVPTALVVLETLPLMANGKIDRKALPPPQASEQAELYVAPRTPLEEQLTAIWREALALERVGIYDNFFAIGGHSLLISRVLARVRDSFQVTLPISILFKNPTIAALAALVEEKQQQLDTDAEGNVSLNDERQKRPLTSVGREAYRQKRSNLSVVND